MQIHHEELKKRAPIWKKEIGENGGDGSDANSFRVALCTTAPGEADRIARALVDERLAACVNIMPVRSCYLWEGRSIWRARSS